MRDDLADAITSPETRPALRMTTATVTSVTPLEVNVDGQGGLPASRLASYSPVVVGDAVSVIINDGDIQIQGKLISGG